MTLWYPLAIKDGLLENPTFRSMIFPAKKHPFSSGSSGPAIFDYRGQKKKQRQNLGMKSEMGMVL